MLLPSLALTLLSICSTYSPLANRATTLSATQPRSGERTVKLHWQGKKYKTSELPESLPQGTLDALQYFLPWAAEMNYVIQLSDQADFMALTHKKWMSSREWSSAFEPALEMVDSMVPLPVREEDDEAKTTEASAGGGMSYTWGEVHELEYEAVSFFRLANSKHMSSLLAYIAEKEQKPQGWSKRYEDYPGLTMEKPLISIVVWSGPGVEEWQPLNECVNRIARMMLVRRFGKIPYWLSLGIAWNVEMGVRDSLYCFPGRIDFVGVSEHGGWRDTLKSQFRKKGTTLNLNLLASWQPGTYDTIQAGRAWGIVRYIMLKKPEALSPIVEDLRLDIEKNGRIDNPDGTWSLIPDYSSPPKVQQDILERHMGPDFLDEVAKYFSKGMKKL